METGWIRIHRQITDCWVWDDDEPYTKAQAWIYLLMIVNHTAVKTYFDGDVITVNAGQRITSIRKLADKFRWSRSKVTHFLSLLEQDNMVKVESDTKKTLITVINYEKYQSDKPPKSHQKDSEEPQKSHRKATEKPQKSLNNNDNNDKNEKNEKKEEKNIKKEVKHHHGEYGHVMLTHREYERLISDYGEKAVLNGIKKVDEYCQEYGKRYADYNLTLRKWGIESSKLNKTEKQEQPKREQLKEISIPTEFDYRQTSESKIMSYAEWVYKYYGVELTDEVHTV